MVGTPKFNVDTGYPPNSNIVEAGGTIFPGRTIIFGIPIPSMYGIFAYMYGIFTYICLIFW